MLQEERRLNCELHPDSELSVIYIGDNPTIKSRFVCIECILKGGDQYKTKGLSQLIKIKDFFNNPSMHCRRTISDEVDVQIQEITKCIDQLAIFFQKFYQDIQTNLEKLKQNVKSLKIISSTINLEIEKQSNFNELRKIFQIIKTMDSFQGTQEFKQIQEGVNTFSQNFIKYYDNALIMMKTKHESIVKEYKQSLRNIQEGLSQLSSINLYANYEINIFNTENSNDFSFVLQYICKGNLKYHLLYKGTRDGLTLANYWQKCDQQSHLLTIITLKNGNIFGGYSPCKLNKGIFNYVVDNTDSSFIFLQNKQEIYKLKDKDKDKAIYCYQGYGPIFGGGNDFGVYDDFKQLFSNLGVTYDITGYNIKNTRTHLIGDKNKEIIECKVYKIIQFL